MNNCILRFLLTLYVMSFVRITVEANGQAEIFALYNAVVNIATSFCVFQTAVWWAPWTGYCASLSCSCISSSHYCWPTEETSGKPVNLQHSYFLCQTETKQHSMVTRKISVYLWCCITSLLGVKAKQHKTQELDTQIKEMDPLCHDMMEIKSWWLTADRRKEHIKIKPASLMIHRIVQPVYSVLKHSSLPIWPRTEARVYLSNVSCPPSFTHTHMPSPPPPSLSSHSCVE